MRSFGWWAAGVVVSLCLGCSSEDGDDGGAGAGGCASSALGDTRVSLTVGGVAREYALHVPPSATQGKLPLVIGFHGGNGTGEKFAARAALSQKADDAGFVAVYPDGLDGNWNAGTCCGTAPASGTDDVGFVRALVADVSQRACIDPKRVYAIGFSTGGIFTQRLACEAADAFAAVSVVSGSLAIAPESCKPARPIPVLSFHGTADALVPYDGDAKLPSAPSVFVGWAERDGCTDAAPTESFKQGMVSCSTFSACSAGAMATLCTIEGGGHCWPGEATCKNGATTQDISATDASWEFLAGFSLP